MKDGRPFFMAGLWSDAPDMATGEITDSYTVIITDANAAMRVHDRMPVILATEAARQWLEPGPLQPKLLVPSPAEEMTAWRVSDAAKSSRIEPHPGMAEPASRPRRRRPVPSFLYCRQRPIASSISAIARATALGHQGVSCRAIGGGFSSSSSDHLQR
jgi:hypothetical protein